MKIILILVTLSHLAIAGRPDTANLICADARAIVEQNGAITLSTTQGLYDRYVANPSYCGSGERAVQSYVPSADLEQCFIGYVCRGRDFIGVNIVSPIRKCREGSIFMAGVPNADGNDHNTSAPFICRAGKWIPKE